MKKLQILVPHYKSPQEELSNLLDMIYVQRNINFDDIGVIIGNDGDLSIIDDDFLNYYRQKFDIEYHIFEHAGVSSTRNRLLDLATSDFVMFCDDDDTLLSNRSIQIILECIKNHTNANVFRSRYKFEFKNEIETILNDVGETEMFSNIHGVIIRRDFLIKNNIRFYENINVHEDSVFNILMGSYLHYENQEEIIINSQTYIYCHNDNSICKFNSDNKFDFVIRTTDVLINSRYELFKDLINRKQFNHLTHNINSQTVVLYRFLKKLELAQKFDPSYIKPIYIHTALCFKRLLPIIRNTIGMISVSEFDELCYNLFKDENFDIGTSYTNDFNNIVNYVDSLSFEQDPITKWTLDKNTGELTYNQADVAYFIKNRTVLIDNNVDDISSIYYSRGVDFETNNKEFKMNIQDNNEETENSIVNKYSHTSTYRDINELIDEYASKNNCEIINI